MDASRRNNDILVLLYCLQYSIIIMLIASANWRRSLDHGPWLATARNVGGSTKLPARVWGNALRRTWGLSLPVKAGKLPYDINLQCRSVRLKEYLHHHHQQQESGEVKSCWCCIESWTETKHERKICNQLELRSL